MRKISTVKSCLIYELARNRHVYCTQKDIDNAMEKLDENSKTILKMYYYDQLTKKECADKLNISVYKFSRIMELAIFNLILIIRRATHLHKPFVINI